MKEYLNMSDVFVGNVSANDRELSDFNCIVGRMIGDEQFAEYAAHAINSHDELVAEIERLRSVITKIKKPTNDDCMKFLCTAFRHCDYEIKGDFEIDDMKPAFVLYANSKGA